MDEKWVWTEKVRPFSTFFRQKGCQPVSEWSYYDTDETRSIFRIAGGKVHSESFSQDSQEKESSEGTSRFYLSNRFRSVET